MTWIPGFLGDYEHLKIVQIAIRAIIGLVIVAGFGGPTGTTYMLSMRWDMANYSREKTQEYVDDLKDAVLWLTAKENWNVPVSVFLNELGQSRGQESK